MFDLKIECNVMKYNIHNGAIRWRISTLAQFIWCIFVITLIVFKILTLHICDIENFGQGHSVQRSQWSSSITNINFYKSHAWACLLALTVFEIFTFRNLWPWKCKTRSWSMYNNHSGAIPWQIHDFISACNSNVCSISPFTRYSPNKMQSLILKMKVKEKKRNWRHSSENVRFHVSKFFRILPT